MIGHPKANKSFQLFNYLTNKEQGLTEIENFRFSLRTKCHSSNENL